MKRRNEWQTSGKEDKMCFYSLNGAPAPSHRHLPMQIIFILFDRSIVYPNLSSMRSALDAQPMNTEWNFDCTASIRREIRHRHEKDNVYTTIINYMNS